MWDVGDQLLGTGGIYGFGYDPSGGYAFGVTNQGARVESFYSPRMFDRAVQPIETGNLYAAANTEVTSAQSSTVAQQTQRASASPAVNALQPSAQNNWILPLVVLFAAMALLK